jgi:L-asparaginase
MTPQVWLQLSTRINELLSRTNIAGAVVTHGTNTLEETAYFLDLTVTSSKPVVLVGAQRPASDPDADGPRNLLDAIRVATSPDASAKVSWS